jgi:hypothetical protein
VEKVEKCAGLTGTMQARVGIECVAGGFFKRITDQKKDKVGDAVGKRTGCGGKARGTRRKNRAGMFAHAAE